MPKKKGGHLTMADRMTIEGMPDRGGKISEIAGEVGVCRGAVRDEAGGRRVRDSARFASHDRNACFFKDVCDVGNVCRGDRDARCATCGTACRDRVCERPGPVGECPKTDVCQDFGH